MKKIIVFIPFYISMNACLAQNYVFVKCISGDCENGKGVAIFNDEKDNVEPYTYSGEFKNGKMWGEGSLVNSHKYFIGNFEKNFEKGYGSSFYPKEIGEKIYPDSSGYVDIGEWDGDGCKRVITVQRDNYKVYNSNTSGKKYHSKFRNDINKLMADPWIGSHVKALLASPSRGGVPQYEESIIAQKKFTAQKGVAVEVVEWDCLTDRRYYVTASGLKNGTYIMLPFGGYVNYQVIAEDGSVVFEAASDTYWTPAKAGKYKFLVKFDQSATAGNGNTSVDAVTLACSLRSKRQTN
ncbi:MAG: hypothetical protein ABIP30_13230 [Ferruginibacter sp.]